MSRQRLSLVQRHLLDSSKRYCHFEEIITLPVTLGKVPHGTVSMIDFLIINHSGAYNIILGRPFLTMTKAIVFMPYITMKIPTANKVITIKGDRQSARGCYSVASKVSYQITSQIHVKGYPTNTTLPIHLIKSAVAKRR